MIKHLVFWNFKDSAYGMDKSALIAEMARKLQALPPIIPQIRFLQTGTNFSSRPVAMDLALVSDFDSAEDLKIYAQHPDHQAVAQWLKEAVTETRVVDYEY